MDALLPVVRRAGGCGGYISRRLQTFADEIGSDATHFTALTYQELFSRMEPLAGAEHAGDMAYLRDRYMAVRQKML